jgi:hypothetical protein
MGKWEKIYCTKLTPHRSRGFAHMAIIAIEIEYIKLETGETDVSLISSDDKGYVSINNIYKVKTTEAINKLPQVQFAKMMNL